MSDVRSVEVCFGELIELNSAELRADYLRRVGLENAILQVKLERLLEAHEKAGSFLQQDSVETTREFESENLLNSSIGPYKLRERLGAGGMGVVWAAEQRLPLKRKVALKLIKPGMDSEQVIARFEAEREALSRMDHPHIARVLDAGTTEQGHPYFVMELIRGLPVTEYCDKRRLTIRERLELFTKICSAVQHAHQKGVIHRDIKPSNVLVSEQDGQPVPKVIDFGVAKALHQPLTDRSLYTGVFQALGTLQYMSPEQAGLSIADVDTRADVYGLGVLLYELLTGSTPSEKEQLASAAFDEACRMIREQEPPKPSTRLSTLGERALSISETRNTDPRQLSRLIRGDLDWIVTKSLDKDRNRRYESANSLAADINHYINCEPIEARPPSLTYRLKRFAYRNQRTVASVMLVSLALFSVGGLVWQRSVATYHQQQAAKRDVQLAQAITNEIQSLILQNRFDDAGERLFAANEGGLSDDTVQLLSAQVELFRGNFEGAVSQLREISRSRKDNDRNVVPLLSYALQRSGLEQEHLEKLPQLFDIKCETFSQYLFRGAALKTFHSKLALKDLEDARRIDPTNHLAMWLYSSTLLTAASRELDSTKAVQGLDEAIQNLDALVRYLPDNSQFQSDLALANYRMSLHLAELLKPAESDIFANKADALYDSLPLDTESAYADRAWYLLSKGKLDLIQKELAEAKHRSLSGNFQIQAAAIAQFRMGNDDTARALLESSEPDYVTSIAGIRAFTLLEKFSSRQELATQFSQVVKNRKSEPGIFAFQDWIVYKLAGEERGVLDAAKSGLTHSRLLRRSGWGAQAEFQAGNCSFESALDACEERFDVVHTQFYAATAELANGKRAKAIEHLEAVLATGEFDVYLYGWAQAFLERLRADKNWLPWLND